MPPNFPYFYVQFGYSCGYIHVVDDEKKFDGNFGRQVRMGDPEPVWTSVSFLWVFKRSCNRISGVGGGLTGIVLQECLIYVLVLQVVSDLN